MDASQLHVVACIYNPIRWGSRVALAREWAAHMLAFGVKLTIIECALGDRPFELEAVGPGVEMVQVRARTLAWTKENLINLALERSAYRTPYIAWVDADVTFRSRTWATDTVHALQQYAVVQPWAAALDLGPDGEPMTIKGTPVQTSFSKVWHDTLDIQPHKPGAVPQSYASAGRSYPHPGYAWAIRREVLNNLGGLIEASGLGAGDHQMALAFVGKINDAVHQKTTANYQAVVRAWAERAYKHVQGSVGYVSGTLEHAWHGEKEGKHGRKYQERWRVLIEEQFDPITDIVRNLDGVIELAGNKPRMAHRFDQYFRQRNEDANVRLEC